MSKTCEYFLEIYVKKCDSFPNFAKNAKDKRAIVKIAISVRALCMRGNFKNRASNLLAGNFSEKRAFMRASKIWRGFLVRVF